jgi:hypothetical protein
LSRCRAFTDLAITTPPLHRTHGRTALLLSLLQGMKEDELERREKIREHGQKQKARNEELRRK